MLAKVFSRFWGGLCSVKNSESGNILMLVGLALPVLLGIAGLAIEGANWYTTRRDLQNAADAAAVAAATNGSSNYLNEARAMAMQYGFTDGSNNTTVDASNAATCPSGGTNCYSVTITKKIPLVFAEVLGFSGNTTIGTSSAVQLTAAAIAKQGTMTHDYCLLALGDGTGNSAVVDITANGAPKANLSGCGVASMQSMNCNGSNGLGADYGDAIGTNNGCGAVQNNHISSITDPYAALNSSIPSDTCGGSYPGQTWGSGTRDLTGNIQVCGNLTINGDVSLTGTGIILITNGNLILGDNQSLKTAAGAGATIIFSGSNNSAYSHVMTGGNMNTVLDINAPTSGTWSGIAMYQATNLTQNVAMTYSGGGQAPTINVTGVIYLPHSAVEMDGSVSKGSSGKACIIMVVATITFNGGGYTADRSGCPDAGVTMTTGTLAGRTALVD